MANFGKVSLERLEHAHPDLQRVCHRAIRVVDFTIIETHRTLARQQELVNTGKSQTLESKHVHYPSKAIDIAPWPIDWNDTYRFIYLAGVMFACAHEEGVELRWGGNWDRDLIIINDQSFNDLVHYELI